MRTQPTRLLVSVRSATEAEAALAGGADIIDVKEPNRGSLGRADASTIDNILATIGGRAPVSVALGEWNETRRPLHLKNVAWAKLGFRQAAESDLTETWDWAESLRPTQFIPVAYADAQRVEAPSWETIFQHASLSLTAGLLIDTAVKDGLGLLHWCKVNALCEIAIRCRHAGLFLALAGSLSLDDVKLLMDEVQPDIIAVRGTVCEGALREGRISVGAVATLKDLIRAGLPV